MVALIVGLESVGLPLPGETILVLAAIYAATEPNFNVWVLVAVAAFGAIIGDNIGYWLGSRYGYALLLRYGERIGMFEPRIKLGQYLFLRHGAQGVFLIGHVTNEQVQGVSGFGVAGRAKRGGWGMAV